MHHISLRALTFCLIFASQASNLMSAEWNQWRGPLRDGLVTDAEWPAQLDGHLELAWEKPLSPSYSGPVIHKGMVFTTETVDRKNERVTAYELASGEQVWSVEWKGAMSVPFFAASNGDWIRSTPVLSLIHI